MPVPTQGIEPRLLGGLILYGLLLISTLIIFTFELLHEQEVNTWKKKLADAEARLLKEKEPDADAEA